MYARRLLTAIPWRLVPEFRCTYRLCCLLHHRFAQVNSQVAIEVEKNSRAASLTRLRPLCRKIQETRLVEQGLRQRSALQ